MKSVIRSPMHAGTRPLLRLSLLLLLPLALAACQMRPPAPDFTLEHPEALRHWDISGRLAYRTASDGGSASLEWRQRAQGGQIHFSGPLGFGSAELHWNDHIATLDNGREQRSARSPAELAWYLTGMMIPVDALHFWVRGLPWPWAHGTPTYDDTGQLIALEQLGWSLAFDRYGPVAGLQLPHRVRAQHGEERFTLVVQRWAPQR